MKFSTLLLVLVLSNLLSFGQDFTKMGGVFFDLPVDSSFQFLCNNVPLDTIKFKIKEHYIGTIKREGYSTTFFSCQGYSLIVKDTTLYNSKHIETSLSQKELWLDGSDFGKHDSEDSVIWVGAAFSINLQYVESELVHAKADFKKFSTLTEEAGFILKKIKYGKSPRYQENGVSNSLKNWGKRAYLDNNLYSTISWKFRSK